MVWFFELCVVTGSAPGLPRTQVSSPVLYVLCCPCFLDLQVDQVQRHAPDRALPPGPFLRLRTCGQYVPPLPGLGGGSALGEGGWEGRGPLGLLGPSLALPLVPQGPECSHCDQMSLYKAPEGEAASGSGGAQTQPFLTAPGSFLLKL